jgi:hypothetical protein
MEESTIHHNNTQHLILNLSNQTSSGVSAKEQEVLDEYERLSENMKEVTCRHTFEHAH